MKSKLWAIKFAFLGAAFGASPALANNVDAGAGAAQDKSSQPNDLFTAGGVFSHIADILIFIIGAVAVIMLIIGGLRYVISQGDAGAVKQAKDTILYAIIGIVVAIMAYAIVHFVATSLGPHS